MPRWQPRWWHTRLTRQARMTACSDETPCPHCDQPCHDPHCRLCRAVAYRQSAGDAVMATRPYPADHQLHDLAPDTDTGGVRVGAVGRCPHCGGRTYRTDSGPWCPRAGCAGDQKT